MFNIIDKNFKKYLSILSYSKMNKKLELFFCALGFGGSVYALTDWISRLHGGTSFCQFGSFFTCNRTLSLGVTEQLPLNLPILGICYFCLLAVSGLFPTSRLKDGLNLIAPLTGVVGLALLLWQLIASRTLCPPCAVVNVSLILLAIKGDRPALGRRDLLGAILTVTLLSVSALAVEFGIKKALTHFATNELEASFEVVLPSSPDVTLTFGTGPGTAAFELILDPQCPHCADHLSNLSSVLDELGVSAELRVYWFPIDDACNSQVQSDSFPNSCQLVSLFNCAGTREEELVSTFFKRRALATIPVVPGLESSWGISPLPREIWGCIDDERSKRELAEKIGLLSELGVQGAPVTVSGGAAYEGVLNKKFWRELILRKKFSKNAD